MPANLRKERKKHLFEIFGIDEFAEVKIANLSTGMKQKASLAISLVHDPDIVIFDEPTNGLDVLTARVVTDFLLQLKEEGKTVIVSTHIFSLIERICDRVGIIINGTMIECGTLAEICAGKSLEDRFLICIRIMSTGKRQIFQERSVHNEFYDLNCYAQRIGTFLW